MATTTVSKPMTIPCENVFCRRPLLFFSLITFGVSWIYAFVVFALLRAPVSSLTVLPYLLGPTIGAFVMTATTEGRSGLRRMLQRFILWRVHLFWYLFILIGVPLAYILGILILPGGIASYQPASALYWLALPLNLILILLTGGPLFEEPGWRGFALPRLQDRYGPLVGTLMIGLLWAVWHLPFYFIPGWADLNGGLSLASIAVFGLSAIAFAIIMTWVFNHTHGSLMMAMLFHASVNNFQGYGNRLFPALANSLIGPTIGFAILALLILILTRGRLGYTDYQRDRERLVSRT